MFWSVYSYERRGSNNAATVENNASSFIDVFHVYIGNFIWTRLLAHQCSADEMLVLKTQRSMNQSSNSEEEIIHLSAPVMLPSLSNKLVVAYNEIDDGEA